MEQLTIMFSLENLAKCDEETTCPDVSGCSSRDPMEVRAPAKDLPKTFAERPTSDPGKAPNGEHREWHACKQCSRWYAASSCRLAKGQALCCGTDCWLKFVVASGYFKGERNPMWLGGVSSDNMRYRRRQMEREPLKEATRLATRQAIRSGRLVRQPCEKCSAERAHAHHDDYTKPLNVRWLCRPCHTAHHVAERAALRLAKPASRKSRAKPHKSATFVWRGKVRAG